MGWAKFQKKKKKKKENNNKKRLGEDAQRCE